MKTQCTVSRLSIMISSQKHKKSKRTERLQVLRNCAFSYVFIPLTVLRNKTTKHIYIVDLQRTELPDILHQDDIAPECSGLQMSLALQRHTEAILESIKYTDCQYNACELIILFGL